MTCEGARGLLSNAACATGYDGDFAGQAFSRVPWLLSFLFLRISSPAAGLRCPTIGSIIGCAVTAHNGLPLRHQPPMARDPAARAPRGTRTVAQAFFQAVDEIPEDRRADVIKAALTLIRDQIKEAAEKARLRGKSGSAPNSLQRRLPRADKRNPQHHKYQTNLGRTRRHRQEGNA
jgi:hypothetical protein